MKLDKIRLLLLAILLLGLFFRLYNLAGDSFWADEGYSLIRTVDMGFFQIVKTFHHAFFYNIILHYWIDLFGNSEFPTRLLSVIFGCLAIFMIYKVGESLFNKNVGILSSLILSVSVFHINYSQEVRDYSLMVLLTLMSFYFFINLFKKRSILISVGYVLSSIFLIYTHGFGVFIIIAQNVYFITVFYISKETHELDFKKWLWLQVILLVLSIPWLWILADKLLSARAGYPLPTPRGYSPRIPSLNDVLQSFITYSGSLVLFRFFLVLSLFSIISCKKLKENINLKNITKAISNYRLKIDRPNITKAYLLLVWVSVPIIFPFIMSLLVMPVYHTRYTMGASLAFYLLAAKGITNINSKYLKSVIIAIILLLSFVNVYEFSTQTDKRPDYQPFREAANYIDINAESGDLLLFHQGLKPILYVFDYYSNRADLVKRSFPDLELPELENTKYVHEGNIRELDPILKGYNRVWFVHSSSCDYYGLINKTLSGSYNLLYYKRYSQGLEISLFEKPFNKKTPSR